MRYNTHLTGSICLLLSNPKSGKVSPLFEIVFLGTSASAPSIHRGLSAQVVMHDEYRFLIDCGEGTQRQILQSGLGFKRLNRILITHGHLDHILGLAGLLSTFMRWETIDKLEIYGGEVGSGTHPRPDVWCGAARRAPAYDDQPAASGAGHDPGRG